VSWTTEESGIGRITDRLWGPPRVLPKGYHYTRDRAPKLTYSRVEVKNIWNHNCAPHIP